MEKAEREVLGGTATPWAVPTWPRPRRGREKGGSDVSSVHRLGEGGATAAFIQRLGKMRLVAAIDTAALRAVHRRNFPERVFFRRAG